MASEPDPLALSLVDAGWINLLLDRKAALWVGPEGLSSERGDTLTAEFLGAPWSAVFCHPSYSWIESHAQEGRAAWREAGDRHSIDFIKSDPARLEILEGSTPFFFLDGVERDPDPNCRPDIPSFSRMSRRINMMRHLVTHHVDLLVVVGVSEGSSSEDLAVILREAGVREIVFVDEKLGSGQPPLDGARVFVPGVEGFVLGVIRKALELRAGTRLDVRFRIDDHKSLSVDLTACEAVGHPIRARFEMVRESDLHRRVLSEAEIERFFTAEGAGWQPFAAGLPWPRGEGFAKEVLGALGKVHRQGPEKNATAWLETEPGAGTTTLLRQLAFQAADAGYPVLFARQGLQYFDVAEVGNFLTKSAQQVAEVIAAESGSADATASRGVREVPWLVVFDVEHLAHADERPLRLCERLQKSGRAAVVLCPFIPRPDGLGTVGRASTYGRNLTISGRLRHTLEREEALDFGRHVNAFLAPEKQFRDEDWLRYWRTTTPRLGDLWASESTFWVALHFWLRRQIVLDKPIRQWLYQHFREAIRDSRRLGHAILEIAAVSYRMKAIPLELLGASEILDGGRSLNSRLEDVAVEYPSLGLRRVAKPFRGVTIAHPLLAKQLLEAVALDAEMQEALGLGPCDDVVDVEMALYKELLTRESIRERANRPLVNQLAQEILKVDTETNPALNARWERAIAVLEGATDGVWDTNRVFNHHVAISRRNIARMFTRLGYVPRREQFALAEEHLTWARRIPMSSEGDDRDVNLLNTLGLVYDSWADLEQAEGQFERASELRDKAIAEFLRAETLEPDSEYVVESMASHWLRRAEEEPENAPHHAVEALLYLEHAQSLEGAGDRRKVLEVKSERAYRLLGEAKHLAYLGRLRDAGSEIGYLGFSRLELGAAGVEESSPAALGRALAILDQVPPPVRSWRTYRQKYEIVCRLRPLDFLEQAGLMDQMAGTEMVWTLRQRLEFSILQYQVGKIDRGRDGFQELRTLLNSPNRGGFVVPPPRLRWLRTLRDDKWIVWHLRMKVVRPHSPHRAWCVPEWRTSNVEIPFSPLQFGMDKVTVGARRECVVRFNHNGPMAVPPEDVDA